MADERYDVIKMGSRYLPIRTRDNTPMGKTHATRAEAWDFIHELQAEVYGNAFFGLEADHKADPFTSAVGTVERTEGHARKGELSKKGQSTTTKTQGKDLREVHR
jgi:hypothetical protein